MTPQQIVDCVEVDMKEGGMQYQPKYWQSKLLERIKSLVEREVEKAAKGKNEPAQS